MSLFFCFLHPNSRCKLNKLDVAIVSLFNHREGDKMMPLVEKKIAELEMGLLHLQQNIDIPEITLTFHPFVVGIVKKCTAEGRKPSPEDFADKAEDSTFLNALQHGVNRWIREIQKVFSFKSIALYIVKYYDIYNNCKLLLRCRFLISDTNINAMIDSYNVCKKS